MTSETTNLTDGMPPPGGPAPPVERRQADRLTLNVTLAVRERGRTAVPAVLASISSTGCKLGNGFFSTTSRTVWVKLPGLENTEGNIVWTDGICAGVAFVQPLHPAVLTTFAARHGAPGAATGSLSPAPAAGAVLTLPPQRRDQILSGNADPNAAVLRRKKATGARALSDLVVRTEPRRADHRREERHPAIENGQSIPVTVSGVLGVAQNLSTCGLMASMPLTAGIGETVEVRFAGFDPLAGQVVWLRAGRVGIELGQGALDLTAAA